MAPHDFRRLLLAHRDAGLDRVLPRVADAPSRTPGAPDVLPSAPGRSGTGAAFPMEPAAVAGAAPARHAAR